MGVPKLLRPLLVMALALVAAAGTAASASGAPLAVQHQSAVFTDVDGDGIYRPGDTLRLTETLQSLATAPLTQLQGTLSVGTPNVSFPSGAVRPFPVAAPGASVSNATPFQISLLSGYECGQPLDLGMNVMDGQPAARAQGDQVDLPPYHLTTGAEGPSTSRSSTDVPKPIADAGTTDSALQIATNGRVKQIRVRIGSITHTATGELKLTLIAPDGTQVLLADGRGGTGDNFTNTIFTVGGTSIAGASAPFTGTYAAEGPLASLIDREQDGTWKLRVQDTTGGNAGTINDWGLDIASATCALEPEAVLDINPSPADPGQTVTFDASGSNDPTGTIAKYQWDLDGNGTYEVDSGTSPTTSRSYSTRGSYNVGLKITSDSGHIGITHVLLPVTTPPVAAFQSTPVSPLSGDTTDLDASGSSDPDPGGTIVRWEWDLNDDGVFETDNGTDTVQTSWPIAGDHLVRLRVTDNDGATTTTSHTITVSNRPPVALLNPPQPAVVGSGNQFSATGSTDTDGDIVKYEWDLDGDGTYEQDTGSTPTATHTYSASGYVTAHVRVTDNLGDTSVDAADVQIANAPTADIHATPNPARPGDTVGFDASGSTDTDGTVVSYRWDFDGDGIYDTPASATPTTTHSYLTSGTFPAKVLVKDNDGATNTATVDVNVVNQLPIASITAAPSVITAGGTVSFDASGSTDPDGSITKYEWDLDGTGGFEVNGGTNPVTARSYPNAGLVIVRVRVTDDTLGTKIATAAVTINQASGGGSGPGVGSGGGGVGSDPTLTGGPVTALAAVLGGPATQRLKDITKGGVKLTCRSTQNGTCAVALEVSAKDAIKLKLAKKKNKKPVVVGRATVATKDGADAIVQISLSSKVKKALKKGKRVKVMARASAQAGGNTASATRAVTLRK